ncbi:hypothetical protein CULC22_00835 [Corynebacterium ulcerans BR-AD22]|nr:hypothetical protein CULC22_00835 [Corynebacterium ulcerans BR-AD22]
MNIEGAFSVYSTSGIQIAKFLFELSATTSKEDIAAQFGFHPQWLGSVLKLGRDLFGAKRASKQRQEAIAIAEANHLGIEILRVTNAALSKLSGEASISREALRKRLYRWARGKTVLEAKAEAAAQVVALNSECGKPQQTPAARISRNTDADGMRHVHASLHDDDASAISEKLNSLARHLRRHNPTLTYSHALALALKQSILQHDAANIPRREGLILLPADGLTHIGDGMLATTDGALIPAKDLAEHLLADLGYAVIYALNQDGVPEPVDLSAPNATPTKSSASSSPQINSPAPTHAATGSLTTAKFTTSKRGNSAEKQTSKTSSLAAQRTISLTTTTLSYPPTDTISACPIPAEPAYNPHPPLHDRVPASCLLPENLAAIGPASILG